MTDDLAVLKRRVDDAEAYLRHKQDELAAAQKRVNDAIDLGVAAHKALREARAALAPPEGK